MAHKSRSRRLQPKPDPAPAARDASPGKLWLIAGLLAATATALYVNVLTAPFVFDDRDAILENPYIRQLWPLTQAISAPAQSAVAGRPVVSLSFALSHALSGLAPWGYRVWNLGVHVAVAWLLFLIVRSTLARGGGGADLQRWATPFAGTCAFLWLAHPVNTEVIGYVTQRTESMMGLFYLATMVAALRSITDPRRARGWALVAIGACATGMATKESMATAPLMVLLYDAVFGAGSIRRAIRSRPLLYSGLALSWIVLAVLIAGGPRWRSAGFSAGVSSWTYLLNQAPMVATYIKLAVWPVPLVLDYGVVKPLSPFSVWPQGLLVLGLLGLTVAWWRHDRRLAFLGTWFFITLAPSSSIVPIATEVGAERRMYVPLMAAVVLALVAWSRMATRLAMPRARQLMAGAALLLVGGTFAILTVRRNAEYRSEAGIWETVLERRPHARAHYSLGVVLSEQGQRDEALVHYRQSIPDEPAGYYALGFQASEDGRFDEAESHLREFLRLRPNDIDAPRATALLGNALLQLGRAAEALEAFRATLRMRPADVDARGGAADALTALGRFAEATAEYQTYVRVRPEEAVGYDKLGLSLVPQNREVEAIDAFTRAVALTPTDARLRLNLGHALATVGRLDEAAAQYRTGLTLEPTHARLHSALGLVLIADRQADEGRRLVRRAFELAPDDESVREDYEIVFGAGPR